MTTLTGNISKLAAGQLVGFFAALESAPDPAVELSAFADMLDLGFLPGSQTAKEVSVGPTQYVIDIYQQDGITKLGTVTYTGSGFLTTSVGDPYVPNEVLGAGTTVTGISMVNTSGYALWQYTGSMNVVTLAGGEVTAGSFNATELRMGSTGVGAEMVLSGNLTVSVTSGTTGSLSGHIYGLTTYVRQGDTAYKITIGGDLVPTASLIEDAMGDIQSVTSNLTGEINTLSIDRIIYSDGAGQVQSGSSNLVTMGDMHIDPTDFDALMFAMENDHGPDMSFNQGGQATTTISTGNDFAQALALQGDGKILVAGVTGASGPDTFVAARYNSDGTLDTSFGTSGVYASPTLANTALSDLVVLPGGQILFAGSFTGDLGFGNGSHTILGRFTTSGALDSTFSPGGLDGDGIMVQAYETAPAKAMAVHAATTNIYTAGDGFVLHRFTSTGVLDMSFDGDGTVTPSLPSGVMSVVATDMAIDQATGKLVVLGTGSLNAGGNAFTVARFNADGTPDTSFDGDGWSTISFGGNFGSAAAMLLEADGRIVVVGNAFNGLSGSMVVARFNADGSPDYSFGWGGGITYLDSANPSTWDSGTSIAKDAATGGYIIGGSAAGSAIVAHLDFWGHGRIEATPLSVATQLVSLIRQADGALVIATTAQGDPGNGLDWTVGRLVDSQTTMNQILLGGNDTLSLTPNSDIGVDVYGYTGNDTITGGAGNDTLDGGPGNDSLVGGAGFDRADYGDAPAAISATFTSGGAGSVTVDGNGGTDTLVQIEEIRGSQFNDTLNGGSGNDSFIGRGGNDTILAGDGDDTLNAGPGADSLDGGLGTDLADYANDPDGNFDGLGVVVNLTGSVKSGNWSGISYNVGAGTAQDGWLGTDTLTGIENLRGSIYKDVLFGNAGANSINGGEGGDLLIGADGNDTLDGGTAGPDWDFDWVSYSGATGAVTVNLGAGTATGDASVGSDVLLNIDGAFGSNYGDALTGGSASQWFNGQKYEWFQGNGGNDTIDGGRGTAVAMDGANFEWNIVRYNSATVGVSVNLASGSASDGVDMDTVTGGMQAGTDTLIGINFAWGSAYNDTLTGGNATFDYAEGFNGGAGSDAINGGSGFDWAAYRDATSGANVNLGTGSASDGLGGSDTLTGIEGVVGSDHNDTMTGSGGDEKFQGRAGSDVIDGGLGTDWADYHSDYDANGDGFGVVVNLGGGTLNGSWSNVPFGGIVTGTALDSSGSIDNLTNIENVRGSMYNDVIHGTSGNNVLNGSAGQDLLVGYAGNDTLDGGTAGPDYYFDWAGYFTASDAVSVNLGAGTATGDVSVGSDTLLNIDGVSGSSYGDTLTGGSNSQWFNGLKLEWFQGNGGNDTIDGGRGTTAAMDAGNLEINVVRYDSATAGVTVNLATGTASDGVDMDTVTGGMQAGTDTLIGINWAWGSAYNDTLTGGNPAFDYVEQFNGSGGNDVINGGSGFDYATYRNSTSGAVVNLATGNASDGLGGTDTLTGIEGVIGSDHNDAVTGSGGDERFQGRAGNDIIDGGLGTDWADYHNDFDGNGDGLGVVVNLTGSVKSGNWSGIAYNVGAGTAQDGWLGTDTLTNIENLRGSIYKDVLFGNAGANSINGGEGGDLLIGADGNDTLDGGTAGRDPDFDWVSYSGATGAVTVNLGAGTATGDASVGSDVLLNIDGAFGSNYGDALTGGSASQWFNGQKYEWFQGNGGNDTIDGGRGTAVAMDGANFEWNIVRYNSATVGVSVNLASGSASDGVDMDTVTGGMQAGTDTLIGINFAWGSAYNDTLTGGNATFDYAEGFNGGAGSDAINGGSGFDWAAYRDATSGANVNLGTGSASDGLGGSDTLTGIEGVVGSDHNDTMTGSGGDEKFQGRAGNDVIDGGLGTDWADYHSDYDANGDGLGVVVNLTGGTKSGTWYGVAYNVAAGTAQDGWGNTDTLANIENLRGSIYKDALFGNSLDNLLTGGLGNDSLDGGLGQDVAVYSGVKSGYTVTRAGSGWTVTDTNVGDGDEGLDTLTGIEKLQFADGTVTLGAKISDPGGDGKSDLLIRNADGATLLWQMNGTTTTSSATLLGPGSWSIANGHGDYNGDGKSDLLVQNSNGDTRLWLMNGSAITSSTILLGPGNWRVIDGQGDYDGDGKSDLLVRNSNGDTRMWLMNGTTTSSSSTLLGAGNWSVVEGHGDYNGDGKSDLIVRNADGTTLMWLMNGGVVSGSATLLGPGSWSVISGNGDYNGDGKSDLLVRNANGDTRMWLMNGTTTTSSSVLLGPGSWNVVDGQGDYNGDGKSDLLVRNSNGDTRMWLMDGTTTSSSAVLLGPGSWGVADGHSDTNGDGKSDLVVQNSNGDTRLWLMNGTTTSSSTVLLGPGAWSTWQTEQGGVVTGDAGANSLTGTTGNDQLYGNAGNDSLAGGAGNDSLDGGADSDTAVFSGLKATYSLAKAGTGWTVSGGGEGLDTLTGIEKLQFADGTVTLGAKISDPGGDGKSDLLIRNADGATLLWQMNGTTTTSSATLLGPGSWSIANGHGDYNGDGKSDLLVQNSNGDTRLWLMNGSTITSSTILLGPGNWRVIDGQGDYDGDGKSDLLVRNSNGDTRMWLMNGTTTSSSTTLLGAGNWSVVEGHGDYNGDGKSDLIVRNADGTTLMWLMNGGGVSGSATLLGPGSWSVISGNGDYNGDGKSDLLVRNANGDTRMWLMNGTTTTSSSVLLGPGSWNVIDGQGDYNGDGKSDLLVRNSNGDTRMWLMDGTTTSSSSVLLGPGSWGVADGHSDTNGDGKSDLVVQNSNGDTRLWLMNGTTTSSSTVLLGPGTWSTWQTEQGGGVTGDAGANSLTGTTGNDQLYGNAGNDSLSGGGGNDQFVFNTALNAGTNVDTITDFSRGADQVLLDHLIFTALGVGTLAAGSFVAEAGAVAHDGNDVILYDTTTGNLSYDPDGSGAGAATLFANLATHPAIVAGDLAVI